MTQSYKQSDLSPIVRGWLAVSSRHIRPVTEVGRVLSSLSSLSAEQVRDRALRGGLIFILARLVLQGFQWVATLLVARLLLPEHYGLMAVVSMVTELAGLMACAGLGSALVQKVSTTHEQEGQLFTISLVLTSIIYAAVWVSAPAIAAYLHNPEFATLLRVVSLSLLLVPLTTVCNALLERDLRLSTLAAIQIATSVIQSGVVLSLAFADYGVWALGLGVLCGSVVYSMATWHQSGWRPRLALPTVQSMGLVRFGSTVAATTLIWFVNQNSDKMLVTALLGPAALGLYAMAYQLAAMPVDKITSSVNRASFATYGRLRGEPDRLSKWYLRMVAGLFATIAPALIGAALIAADAIPLLLGDKWHGMIAPFQILAPAGALMAIAATVSPLINALGRPDIPMKYEMTCAVVFPISILIAAGLGGLLGVCIVWVIVYPIMVSGLIHASRHLTGIPIGRFLRELSPFAMALAVMALAVIAARTYLAPADPGTRMLLSIVVGAVAYISAAVVLMGPSSALNAVTFFKNLVSRSSAA